MHFAFTEEQAMIAEAAKSFFAENATSARTRAAMDKDGVDRALWRSYCQDLGFGGLAIPEEHGGSGLGMVELAIVAEAAGAQVAALPMLGSLAMAAQAIAAGGTHAQKAKWLPLLASGEKICAFAETHDLRLDGETLTGSFDFVPHAAAADVFVLGGSGRAFLVERNAPGLSVKAFTTLDQTRPLARVTLEAVCAEALADGASALRAARVGGWVCVSAEALGGAQACLDKTIAYSRERIQFGRQIGSFQAYKHRLADMMIDIEQARSAVYWAACAVDEGSDEAKIALHAAKSFCADAFAMCAGNAIQLHGGIGFTWEHDAHLYFKRARAIQSMLGKSEAHREAIAAMIFGDAA
jgi:alkylation response protein AidB-like acyl-CoA dehydrogenase